MRLSFIGQETMPLRHRVFTPGDVTEFDMDNPADAALALKCAALPVFEPVTEKRRGRPRKHHGENAD